MASSSSKPKAIIFDCWNTLFVIRSDECRWPAISSKYFHHQFTYPFMKTIEHEIMTKRQDDLRPAIERIMKRNNIKPSAGAAEGVDRQLAEALNHQEPYPETFEVLKKLRPDYKLGLLSNTYHQVFHHLDKTHNLSQYFDIIIPSYEVGRIKPDPEIFQVMLDKLGVMPEQAVMVGDNLRDDAQAAEAVGMRGILIDRHTTEPRHHEQIRSLAELSAIL